MYNFFNNPELKQKYLRWFSRIFYLIDIQSRKKMSHYQTVRNFQRNHLGFPTVISDWRKKERPHPNKTNEWEKETLSKRENNNCSFAIMAYPKKYKCISRAFWCIHYFKWKFLKRRKYGRDGERGRVGAVYIRNKRNFCSARGDGKRGKRVKRNGRKWRVCRIHLLCYDLARFSEGENAFILRIANKILSSVYGR